MEIYILSNWWFPDLWSEDFMVGKAKWKPLELPLATKIVNLKQYHIPGRITEISSTIKNFKNLEVVIPTTSPFNPPILPVPKK